MLSFAAPKIWISAFGKNSTITRATAPTIASAIKSMENSFFTLSCILAPILNPTIGIQPAAIPMTMEMTIWKNFITIPTTAIGICANCSCPKMASIAPYLRIILLIAAIAATRDICAKKLHRPSERVLTTILPFSLKSIFVGLIILARNRYHTAKIAVAIWPITVAIAAPIIPHLKPKMKMGSRIILIAAPTRVDIIANLGLPSARIMGFIACPNI